jgi:uncharacterized protein
MAPATLAAAELGVIAVGVATNVSHRVLSPGARLAMNLGAAGAAVAIARRSGATWEELGLSGNRFGRGLRWGAAAGTAIAVGVAAASRSDAVRARFVDERVTGHGRARATYELAARIPLETALSEEVIFRGALLGLALGRRSTPAALLSSSILFGLWHVLPTWVGLESAAVGRIDGVRPPAHAATVAGVVGATTCAGVAFAALRLRSGSVIAPVLAHAALNMTSFAVTRSTVRRPPVTTTEGQGLLR